MAVILLKGLQELREGYQTLSLDLILLGSYKRLAEDQAVEILCQWAAWRGSGLLGLPNLLLDASQLLFQGRILLAILAQELAAFSEIHRQEILFNSCGPALLCIADDTCHAGNNELHLCLLEVGTRTRAMGCYTTLCKCIDIRLTGIWAHAL